ncbi:MAG: acetyl-CoA C-acyltransferase [Candidatus Latescibacteria bacterium]|nr:acetyl-CoA C-acyltransferase [Candidatus Latescibacterota bacterium]NIO28390.1 acetyl-CoA C-acyltransferase [Candidatus Latescibacterota bacterium]NIO55939.1 acetyl-CoA C-acyltransferase [Candidatus Latescibacterota bacterium]NIT01903.1 acetyl-CoA C-acyltransferase [Candidatus Latescibacterota bacterium]
MTFPLDPPVMILAGARTPWGRFTGSLKEFSATDLGVIAAKEAIQRSGVPPEKFGHTVMANTRATSSLDAHHMGRHVGLKAGLPIEAGGLMLNRLCGGSLQSTVSGAYMIHFGEAEYVLTGGAESLTNCPHSIWNLRTGLGLGQGTMHDTLWDGLVDTYCNLGMGPTAEKLAAEYGITREASDEYALRSQVLTADAQKNGRLAEEIVPVEHTVSRKEKAMLEADETPKETSLEKLANLRPAFVKDGQVTAGNACGLADGAGAIVIGSAKAVERDGIEPLGELLAWSAVGVQPDIMGIGPAPAIRAVLDRTNMKMDDIGLFEINEAFACQVLSVLKDLGLEQERVNVQGGSIALGHPLGSTGARLTLTLLLQMRRHKVKYGISSMCIGGGQGMAALFRNPQAT